MQGFFSVTGVPTVLASAERSVLAEVKPLQVEKKPIGGVSTSADDQYDERKNPFSEDTPKAVGSDSGNPFGDDSSDTDYDPSLNPFSE